MSKYTCPNICPQGGKGDAKVSKAEEPSHGPEVIGPYVPGRIQPPVPKVYPEGSPPPYLPQATDSTSGDILTMGPIGPWAPGHLDWSPHAGCTGVRPVVDKYSITRYSTGEWRKNNESMLTPRATEKGHALEVQFDNDIKKAFGNLDDKQNNCNNMLTKRIKDLKQWKKAVEKAQKDMADEIETLEQARVKLKGASRILMLPEAIAKECLELRTNRYEPDLVRDDTEQELIKEVAIVGEIRRVFNETLVKVEEQLTNNKAAKAVIDMDWDNKLIALKEDIRNRSLTPNSTLILHHKGVARWPENGTSLEYWKHFCQESIKNCDEVRQKSANLRADLMTAIIKGSQDMKNQASRTNAALKDTVDTTEQLCRKLEDTLKQNLQKIAEIENLIDHIKDKLRELDERDKLGNTRLKSRNYTRPNVENCRDEAQYALMDESKFVNETIDAFKGKLREAEAIRSELMKYRGDLEKDIACKRKSLNIDRDRFTSIRAFMPTPEEFAAC